MEPNAGKNLVITVDDTSWQRLPIKTHIIKKGDDIAGVIQQYAGSQLQSGDMLFISERIVAISQGRAWPIQDIKPSPLAKFLSKFVHKSPYGIGLRSLWTMELAIREAGAPRIQIGRAHV